MADLELTREALYQLVWTSPLNALAAEHGTLPALIGAACRQTDIPLPAAGHWTRVELNKPVSRPALPDSRPATELVRIATAPPKRALVERPPPTRKEPRPKPPSEQSPPEEVPQLQAAEPTRIRHDPLVREWLQKREAERREARRRGWGLDWQPDLGQPLEQRRLRVYDLLLRELRPRQFAVSGEHGPEAGLIAARNKHEVSVRIYERRTKGRRPLTDQEREVPWNKGKVDAHHLYPTGEFVLVLKGNFYREIVTEFRDKKDYELEEQIPDILHNIERAIEVSVQRAEERARAEQRAYEDQQERWRRQEEARIRQERRTRLLQSARDWNAAAELRSFIEAVRSAVPVDHADPELAAWLAWAEAEADDLDPIASNRLNLADRG